MLSGSISALAVYDCVGFVKAVFTALGRKNCLERRRCGEAGVKGAFFAFISILDTDLPTSTIGLGSDIRFFLRFDPNWKKRLALLNDPSPHFAFKSVSMATVQVPPTMYSAR